MKSFAPLFLATLLALSSGSPAEASATAMDDILMHAKFTLDEDDVPAPNAHPPQSQPAPERGTAGNVTELGSGDFRFTIEVPDGWTAKSTESGGTVKKNDGSSLLAISVLSTDDMTDSQVAGTIGQKFGVELEKQGNTWIFKGEKDGMPLLIAFSHKKEDGTALVVVCAGPDQAGMSRIFSTFKVILKQQ